MVEPAAQSDGRKRGQTRFAGAVCLILFALAAAWLLTGVQQRTYRRIADNELAERLKTLRDLLPEGRYDNEPHKDFMLVTDADLLGSDNPLPVYRVRLDTQPVAAVLTAVAPNGYAGKIRMLVSIDVQGNMVGVRVTAHRETPGLGDRINVKKSGWIKGFAGLAAADPMADDWVLESDGGSFDELTGATVSSRAVLNAARNAVIYFNRNTEEIFAAPSVFITEANR